MSQPPEPGKEMTVMRFSLLLIAIGLLSWSHARADDVSNPKCHEGGAAALADCLESRLAIEDKHLNAVYGLIMKMLDAGEVDGHSFFYNKKMSLVAAERAWVRFRDAQCGADADMLSGASASGEVGAVEDCSLKMTRERIAYLQEVAKQLASESKMCEKDTAACKIK